VTVVQLAVVSAPSGATGVDEEQDALKNEQSPLFLPSWQTIETSRKAAEGRSQAPSAGLLIVARTMCIT
jgi:hypothetical protein